MSIAVAVSAAVAMACALVAASVALYGKHLDRRLAVEGRHAQARESAYDVILAAGDAAWNYVARSYVSEADTGAPLPEEVTKVETERCNALLIQGTDQLMAAAADMDAIRPILGDYFTTIFANSDGSAEAYERVRDNIVNCRRQDTGLRRVLQERPAGGWRQLLPIRAVREWRARRDEVLRTRPLYRGIEVDQVVRTDDGVTLVGAAGDDFIAVLQEQREWERNMRASVAVTEARLAHWRKKGILT